MDSGFEPIFSKLAACFFFFFFKGVRCKINFLFFLFFSHLFLLVGG